MVLLTVKADEHKMNLILFPQLGDLGFFIALYALFLISFGIMYQAILFPNSTSSPWQLIKDVVYLPYWQVYGELNLEQIEGIHYDNNTCYYF